ncbi:MAG: glyoxylate/hydroxypyruvate reductase A [Gammaproteobacteria bacterium]|nr:glyoxylate/hydroxypyruvate reductase A [Gammaproteobacteria bacterium]MBU1554136.1 glyoxylate/hydroxypyruvate reductase A [Gammaproteobacteria bacterium]MBU2070362.1 glyoxylate/hydroxypyruvate reductase A [Gammaproteobacteria bacterium]MBU2184776.1 glyoxylate/hydroxypyruvate reductase A [Gammaproteobacteria bacterium]MBU2203691.1 glyoxylate/hydroxypyruvate reductase A [Gammaproteobacteria bacterium]
MSLVLIIPDRKLEDLQQRLQQALPDTPIEIWPDIAQPDDVEFAVVWKQPPGSLTSLPNLKAIQCFGAGVDAIIADPTLPALPIARIVDPTLTQTMVRYLDGVISHYRLRLDLFTQQQQQLQWRPKSPRRLTHICLLGLGELGAAAASHFAAQGYQVSGWARTAKQLDAVSCYHGVDGLAAAVAPADVVICLLPLTMATESLLDSAFFQQLKHGTIFVNVARGAIVDDAALLGALDSGQLQAACLDVFRQEPLPAEHPFWRHPAILITPHVSAVTNVSTVVEQIADNYRRSQRSATLLNLVDVNKGY